MGPFGSICRRTRRLVIEIRQIWGWVSAPLLYPRQSTTTTTTFPSLSKEWTRAGRAFTPARLASSHASEQRPRGDLGQREVTDEILRSCRYRRYLQVPTVPTVLAQEKRCNEARQRACCTDASGDGETARKRGSRPLARTNESMRRPTEARP